MRSKGKTLNQIAWQKEVKRITRLINKVKPEDNDFIKSRLIPEQPKRVTKKSLNKLSEINLRLIKELDQGNAIQLKPRKQEPIKRKPRARGTKSTNEIRKPRTHKLNITEEERQKRRERLAKARETMRKRMKQDKDFSNRMHKIWEENLKKARQAKQRKGTTRKRPQQQKRKTYQQPYTPPQPSPTPTESPKELPEATQIADEADTMINWLILTIASGQNERTQEYLIQILQNELDNDRIGTLKRIKNEPDYIKDIAMRVAWDSDPKVLKDDASSMYYLITGTQPPAYVQDKLMELAIEDRGYKPRRNSNSRK